MSSATCAVSPDSSYLFLKQAIDQATKTLLIYIYDLSAPYLIALLAAANKRKVKIRAMYDGNSGGPAELAALKTVASAKNVKAAPSRDDRAVFTVCHQKFLVIDDSIVVVESANWAKSSVPEIDTAGKFKKGNREWFIRFDDKDIAQWFTTLFDADFNIPASAGAAASSADLEFDDMLVAAAVQPPGKLFGMKNVAAPGGSVTPIVSPDNYLKEVKALLQSAEKSVLLQQQYILAGKGIRDLLEIIADRKSKFKKLDLRIITSATFASGWEGTKKTLKAAGMLDSLKALNPKPFTHCHNKGVIVDDEAVVVSSTNWSENSVLRAREAGVLVRSVNISGYYRDVFDLDWKEGVPADEIDASASVISAGDIL
ncbi:MAG: hypothetical protein HY290_01665 [Planctomycetia bacterium]|nr:hypothetical protein [Planctomycetia bacterium]